MRKFASVMLAALSLASAPVAFAAEADRSDAPPAGEVGRVVEMQATVTAIDMATRTVTLKGADGAETAIQVDERARNLPQVKVGDVVKVAYVQALAWKLSKSTKAEPTVQVEEAAGRAKEGEKPGGMAGRRISATVTIEAIDTANGTVTLKGPQGNSRTVKAHNPDNLRKVKVGDLVDVTYTEAVALKVEPASK
jgi:Cu/Ag efflux protein CusF